LRIAEEAREKTGLARIGSVNRATNLAIRATTDIAEYAVLDYWASPLEALQHAAGDCEDYAITKYGVLTYLGLPESELRLVLVRDTKTGQDHAVLFVKVEGRWRILDNRTLFMRDATEAPDYQPVVMLGADTMKLTAGQNSDAIFPSSTE
jgi:predicted transglutaminase-like cysteine proteinase